MAMLKALVGVMGVLILAGLAVIAYVAAVRLTGTDAPAPSGAWSYALPAGSRVVATQTDGGRLVVRATLADGAERIIVLDLATGRVLGTVDAAMPPRP